MLSGSKPNKMDGGTDPLRAWGGGGGSIVVVQKEIVNMEVRMSTNVYVAL